MREFSFSIFPNENFLDLLLYQYGWEQCEPLHCFGPYVRHHYLFHYVVSGRGSFDTEIAGVNQHFQLEANQGFLIPPGKVTTYCADEKEPWKYAWLEFDGLRVQEYLDHAGLNDAHPIYTPLSPAQGEGVRDLMLYISNHAKASPIHLIGHAYLFLDALIQASASRRPMAETQLRDFYIHEAVTYMDRNYHRDLTVEEVADVCKLNRSYFSKLFKESMGCPPQEFLIRMRLTKAAELMKTTRDSIGDIAAACGYPNQLHFSRAFKKRYGTSPREWRNQHQIR